MVAERGRGAEPWPVAEPSRGACRRQQHPAEKISHV